MKKQMILFLVMVLWGAMYAERPDGLSEDPPASLPILGPAHELLQTDRTLGHEVMSKSVDELAAYWTDDVVILVHSVGIMRSKEEIKAFLSSNRSDPNFKVSWEPENGYVEPTGELGYTYGTRTIKRTGENGQIMTSSNPYLTVWKRKDGKWKMAIGK